MSGNVVGSAEFELRATDKKFKEDLARSERDLKGFMGRVEGDASRSSKNIGNSISGMARGLVLGITALTAVFAAGLAMALKFGQASLKMADDMTDSARRIGIGTTALQEWRYVARKTGEDAAAVDAALESFGTKFAQAAAGLSKEAGKDFAALGFSAGQLRSFQSTEQALDAVVDRIGELSNASDRAAIAERLGLGPLASALREGADETAKLRDEAAALGFVMDEEIIKKGAEAQGKLEDLSHVIGVQMAEAFINLSDEVLAFTDHLAGAIKKFNEFTSGYTEARQQLIDEGIENPNFASVLGRQFEQSYVKDLSWIKARRAGFPDAMREARAKPAVDQDDPALLRTMSAEGRAALYDRRTTSTGNRASLTPVQPKGRTDNSAQRAAEREARRAERVEQEIFRARQRALGVADQEALTVQERFDLEKAQVKLEREAEAKELESRKARKDITDEEFKQLKLINDQTAALEDRVASDILARDLADERLAADRMLRDFTLELLGIQAGGATTERERRRIDEEILRLKQIERRQMLERIANDPRASGPERDAARANLAKLPGMEKAENDAFDRSAAPARAAGQIAQGIIDQDGIDSRYADMYSEIDRLRQADVLSAEQAERAKGQITNRYLQEKLSSTSEFFGNLATLANSSNKELAAIGKAAAIAQATIDGILAVQVALRSAPPPMNFALAAAAGATAAVNVAKIAGIGFADGGYTGDGGKYEPAGVVHKGEFVIPKEAVSRIGVAKLQALSAGNLPGFADGGLVGMSLPSMSMPGLSGPEGGSRPQRMVVEVDLKSDMLDAKIDGRAAPMIAHGSVQSARYAKNDTINTLTQQQTYRRGG